MTARQDQKGPLKKDAAPLFSVRAFPVAALMAIAMLWPWLATGHLNAFADSNSYVKGGDAIWRIVGEKLAFGTDTPIPNNAASSGTSETGTAPLDERANIYGRSITYAALFSAVIRTAGPAAMAFVQSLMIAYAILALIQKSALRRPMVLLVGMVLLVAVSQVAWMSSYLMPDVLGAVVLIFSALLACRFHLFSTRQRICLTLLAAFAVSSHYGNIPIALACVIFAGLWHRIFIRSYTAQSMTKGMMAAALIVVAAAPVLNMTASYAVLGETSMTPLRPPVVLARSVEDGPARWYLEEQCLNKETSSTYCDAFDGNVPDTHYELLWGETGLQSTTAEAAESIRENEWQIVLAAALAYPMEQLKSVLRNTVRQFSLVAETGTSMSWTGSAFEKIERGPLRSPVETVMIWITLLAGAGLASLLLTGRLNRSQQALLFVVLFGLVINAFVFGALSAPAERYQARVAWLVPLLLVLFLAETGLSKPANSHPDQST